MSHGRGMFRCHWDELIENSWRRLFHFLKTAIALIYIEQSNHLHVHGSANNPVLVLHSNLQSSFFSCAEAMASKHSAKITLRNAIVTPCAWPSSPLDWLEENERERGMRDGSGRYSPVLDKPVARTCSFHWEKKKGKGDSAFLFILSSFFGWVHKDKPLC